MLAWSAVDVTPPALRTAFVHAVAVNAQGAILAESTSDVGTQPRQRVFVWKNGKVVILDYGQAGWVDATAINARGDVVGDARNEAVLWRGGGPTALGRFEPAALNASDAVVGDGNVGGQIHGYLWRNGKLMDLPGLGGGETHAWQVNAAGEVIGSSALPSGAMHAVTWRDGSVTDLGTIGSLETSATAINDAGTIVGFAGDHVGNGRIAVEWKNGVLVRLGRFGAAGAQAIAVNRAGDVLVQTQTPYGDAVGAVLLHGGRTISIPSLGGTTVATGLDDEGDVIGYGATKQGRRTFVWRSGTTTLLPTTDGVGPPWGGPTAIAGGYAAGDEYVDVGGGHSTSHAVLWRRR